MKLSFILIITSLVSTVCVGQELQNRWNLSIGGPGNEDAKALIYSNDNSLVGLSYSQNSICQIGNNDVVVFKVDLNGNNIWQKCLGGSQYEGVEIGGPKSIIQTKDSGYVFVTRTNSNDGDISGLHTILDIWVCKLNRNGELEWSKVIGGYDNESAFIIKEDSKGNLIIGGGTRSNNGDITCKTFGDVDNLILKLNAEGEILWVKCFGGSRAEEILGLCLDKNDNIIFTSFTSSQDGLISKQHGVGNKGYGDIWVVILDSTGSFFAQRSFGGTDDEIPLDFICTNDGGYLICGISASQDGDRNEHYGGDDAWIIKLNSFLVLNGKKVWVVTKMMGLLVLLKPKLMTTIL